MTKKAITSRRSLMPNPYAKLKEGPEAITENPQWSYMENLEQENKALRENWQELLIFAKEHDAGKSLYVEASEFIDYMNKLEAGE